MPARCTIRRLAVLLLGLVALTACVVVAPGCGNPFKGVSEALSPTGDPAKPAPGSGADAIADIATTLGWIGAAFTFLSCAALVASFFLPIIPRRTCLITLGCSIALGLVRYLVILYGAALANVVFWVSVACAIGAAVVFVPPLAVALKNWGLKRIADTMTEAKDDRAVVALEAVSGSIPNTKDARKARLAELTRLTPGGVA